jgi:hypothetical protein
MDYTKELTLFKGQKTWRQPCEPGKYQVRVISRPQPVRLTCFDETDTAVCPKVTSRESEEPRPIFDIQGDAVVDEFEMQQYDPAEFAIIKPVQRDAVYLDMRLGQRTVPLMLPRDLFTFNEPIEILAGNWKIPEAADAAVIEPGPAYEGEPADLDNSMVMTEVPADVVAESGLHEGPHDLDSVYDQKDFLKSLCNNAIGGGAGGVINNFDLLRDFFPGKKFYLKQYNGKYFVIFKGFAGTRTTLRGARYGLQNPKVMALSAAKSPTAGAGAALKGITAKSALKGNMLTVVVIGVVDLVAWHNGMLSDDGKFISDFIVEFGMDVAKAVVSSIVAGVAVGLGCMIAAGITAGALPVVVVVGAGIVISVLVGMGLDYLDEVTGVSRGARNLGNKVEKSITQAFSENIVEPVSRTLYQLERHVEWLYLRNCNVFVR